MFSLQIALKQLNGKMPFENDTFDFFNYLPEVDDAILNDMKLMILHNDNNMSPIPTLKDIEKVTKRVITSIFAKELCSKFRDLRD